MAVKVEKIVSDALGFAHDEGRALFIEGALPGEVVEYSVREEKNGYSMADCTAVLEPSPLRRFPVCPYYGVCGGCSFQIVDEKSSAMLKEEIVKDNLRRIAGLDELPPFDPPVYGPFEGYRHRARFHVDLRKKEWGFLAKRSSSIVRAEQCPMLTARLSSLLSDGRRLYEEGRSAMFRGEIDRDTGIAEVRAFDGDEEVTFSDRSVAMTVDGIRYFVAGDVFFQSNPSLLPPLFDFIRECASGETIMDLYSGVGTFSALFEGSGRTVYAVERDKRCLTLSRKNAPSAHSFASDALSWGKKSGKRADTVIVDPPRTGLGKDTCSLISSWKPDRIIYISCNSVTAARDLGYIDGYTITRARVFDFYPGSGHEESAYLLERRKEA